jgi:hypothetical protein
MRSSHAAKARLWLIVTIGVIVFCAAYFHVVASKKPLAPTVPVVSVCKGLEPGMRRIGDQYGFQFDVAANDFTVHEGTTDMPPFEHGFRLRPKNSGSILDITFDQRPMKSMAVDPALTFAKHSEKRSIVDYAGQPIGEDYWGYLNTGERWRQVRLFKGGVVAKYGFVRKKEAELFDRVISSACLLPKPEIVK